MLNYLSFANGCASRLLLSIVFDSVSRNSEVGGIETQAHFCLVLQNLRGGRLELNLRMQKLPSHPVFSIIPINQGSAKVQKDEDTKDGSG